jgi:hypothetical protein
LFIGDSHNYGIKIGGFLLSARVEIFINGAFCFLGWVLNLNFIGDYGNFMMLKSYFQKVQFPSLKWRAFYFPRTLNVTPTPKIFTLKKNPRT